jgi:hypothetical protein
VGRPSKELRMTTIPSTNTSEAQALLYQKSVTNMINGTAVDAPHVGYLDKNRTQLEIVGTITSQDPYGYYRFNFRTGQTMQLTGTLNKGVRVQIMDSSGVRVLADNMSKNSSQLKAFNDFKAGDLKLKNGVYVMKVSYGQGVSKAKDLNFDLKISSGNDFKVRYKTLAYPTTYLYQLAAGGNMGYSSLGTTAAMMMAQQDGSTANIFDYYI